MDNKFVVIAIVAMLISAAVLSIVNKNNASDAVPVVETENVLPGEGTKPDTIEPDVTKPEVVTEPQGECMVTGCSNQLCADGERMTTCEFRDEYACYAEAVCERQQTGECGWTLTDEQRACLEDATVLSNTQI